jgi:hypothetical protein
MSWSLGRRTSFFCYFLLELRMPKFIIWRSCWHWYYRRPVRMLNCIHLSCQDYSSPEKHLAAMKNMLLTRRALESECRCSRRHLEEYNQHGVWCWWCQNWCWPFENHNSSPKFFFRVKSRLVSRLRFFFRRCHQMTTKLIAFSSSFSNCIFHLRLQSLLTFALEFVSLPNIIFFLFLFCDPEFFF